MHRSKLNSCHSLILTTVLLLGSISIGHTTTSKLTLARNGHSDYQIVIPLSATDDERRAGLELQRFIEECSGARLPVITDDQPLGECEIILGQNRRLRWLNIAVDVEALQLDGFTIQTSDKYLAITGGPRQGTLNGVYTFLEDYVGYRWYSPTVSRVPRHRTLRVPTIHDTQVSPFMFREVYYSGAMEPQFAARRKLNGNASIIKDGKMVLERHHGWGLWCHTFFALCPPQKYFASHPEYFSLIDGKRVDNQQLCLTNPDLLRLFKDELRKRMQDNPNDLYWSVSQNDCFGNCQCEKCKAIDDREGTPMGTVLEFVNAIAREFPDKIISPLSYQYTRKPPKQLRPEPNVAVMLCSIECNRSRPISTDPDSQSFREDMENWSKICDRLMVYDYIVQFSNLVSPFPNFRVLQPNMQFYVRNHAIGMFSQGNRECGGEFAELRAYLTSHLLWNPDCDVDHVIDDFLEGYYGKAAAPIREYIDLMHDALEKSGVPLSIFGSPKDARESYLTLDLMNRYNALFDQAERKVRNQPDVLLRVQTARMPIQYAQLELGYGSRTERQAVAGRLFATADKTGLLMFNEWNITTEKYKETVQKQLPSQ